MVGLNVTDFLPHGLYQEFGNIIWDFCKHYSRNQETLEIEYNPYTMNSPDLQCKPGLLWNCMLNGYATRCLILRADVTFAS